MFGLRGTLFSKGAPFASALNYDGNKKIAFPPERKGTYLHKVITSRYITFS